MAVPISQAPGFRGTPSAGHNLANALVTYFQGVDDSTAVSSASTATPPISAQTVLYYVPGFKQDAQVLAALLGGADIKPASDQLIAAETSIDPLVRLVVVLGQDHGTEWATNGRPPLAGATTPSTPTDPSAVPDP